MSESLKCLYYEASGVCPYENLALEKVLMDSRKDNEAILYLWQNDHSIIIGKNQDAYAECRVEEFLASGGRIVRRMTGGGAVYHDLGNLNFTFIMPVEVFDIARQMGVVCRALALAGVDGCSWSGRNDLLWQERKCSGNAFQMTKTAGCHHGTLLLRTDMEPLLRYLTVSQSKLQKHGIQSVESRVINLSEIVPNLTIDQLKKAVREAFAMEYGTLHPGKLDAEQQKQLQTETKHFESSEWIYPDTPAKPELLQASFPWGELRICLQIEEGMIRRAVFFTDAMESDWFDRVSNSLKDIKREEASSALLSSVPTTTTEHGVMLRQIAHLLDTANSNEKELR